MTRVKTISVLLFMATIFVWYIKQQVWYHVVLCGQTLYLHRALSIRDDISARAEKGLVQFTALTHSRTCCKPD